MQSSSIGSRGGYSVGTRCTVVEAMPSQSLWGTSGYNLASVGGLCAWNKVFSYIFSCICLMVFSFFCHVFFHCFCSCIFSCFCFMVFSCFFVFFHCFFHDFSFFIF